MAEHPIIFSTEMVRAILDGRKTQTRRIVNTSILAHSGLEKPKIKGKQVILWGKISGESYEFKCPYGQVGDRLWVRENMRTLVCQSHNKTWEYGEFEIEYIADKTIIRCPDEHEEWWKHNWHIRPATTIPSIHMPKWAARIFLEITNIRVERLWDISEKDANAEGILEAYGILKPKAGFKRLWDSINAKRGYGWDKNPWVWVIEFKRT